MFSLEELHVFKAALECDIREQKKTLQEMLDEGWSDMRFEIWLHESEKLLKKTSLLIMDMEAQVKEA